MTRLFSRLLLGVCATLAAAPLLAAAPTPADSVSPFVGTDGHGHTYPGATVPFGMVQLSPDTRTQGWDGSSGYHHSDSTIEGFSHTHLAGTGVGCLGDILLMPTVGDVHLDAGQPGSGYMSRFSHAREVAKPGYYRVFLQDPKVTAELTATARVGVHKYTFPASDRAHIVLDLVHNIGNDPYEAALTVENGTTISGYRKSHGWASDRAVYFVAQFSRPFAASGIEQDGQRLGDAVRDAKGRNIKAFVTYKTAANESIVVKVGIAATGIEGARKNLEAEAPGWDFDTMRAAAGRQWNEALGAVQIDTPDPHLRTTFYSNLYLSFLAPTLFNDADGTYRGLDRQNHAGNFQNYTTFSLWDTYRAENPLLTIVQPRRVGDMVQSLLAGYRESGFHTTPIWPLWGNETWCMIGYHSVPVIADAYFKGLPIGDPETAYRAMRDTAMQERSGLKTYKTLGYVASTPGGTATSRTLEYTVDDWSLARMAEALGHKDDARMFYARAANYRNVFDTSTQFMRGRKADGSWRTPFDTHGLVNDEYTEADAWQYAFAVQHDVPGMISLYGGDAGFIQRLDALFTADPAIHTNIPDITGLIGQYSQGDEQCHHVAYLYDYAGAPWKTQQRVRQAMSAFYADTPAGQCGNNDCGQMSAWYVLSAMGFYPVNPSGGVYVIGSPSVSRAVLHLDGKFYKGRTFTVTAQNNSPRNVYIQSATLNGKPLRRTWFTQTELAAGGELRLTMGPKPNTAWGRSQAARPPSTMPVGMKLAALPPPAPPVQPLPRTVPQRILCGSDDAVGGFVPDPTMLDGATNAEKRTIDTSAPHAAPAAVYQSERYARDFHYRIPVPKGGPYLVRLHFAELFDDGVGERVENVSINGKPALTNFDILAAAGTINKAVVKDFPNIVPDAQGNIVVRITAAPGSPDQNAKICGIEILPAGEAS